jgi:hypothetical protein
MTIIMISNVNLIIAVPFTSFITSAEGSNFQRLLKRIYLDNNRKCLEWDEQKGSRSRTKAEIHGVCMEE